MIMRQLSPGVWGLVQNADPALDFMIGIPDDFRNEDPGRVNPMDPFLPIGRFRQAGLEGVMIDVSLMLLPGEASARDLLECILRLSAVTSAAWKPSNEGGHNRSEVRATLRAEGSERHKQIKVVNNGRFAFRIEVISKSPWSNRLGTEMCLMLDSFRLRTIVPWPESSMLCTDLSTGTAFAYPRTWRIAGSREVQPGCSEYTLTENGLGCTARVLAMNRRFDAFQVARNFAEWFRANGLTLKGAPVAEGQSVNGWGKQFVYAPQAARNGVRLTAGVSMLTDPDASIAVGVIAPDQFNSPWKFAMARCAVDTMIRSAGRIERTSPSVF